MESAQVSTLRRFNRAYTQRIGVLDDSFLESGRPLGPSRVLFEIGRSGCAVSALRARLDLDSGYLSRLLRELERSGLITVAPDPADGRRRFVSLTSPGEIEWDKLDHNSDDIAAGLLGPLSTRQRDRLVEALAAADRLVRVATMSFDVVDPRSDHAQWALGEYFAELDERFTTGFDPGDTLTADAPALGGQDGAFLIAANDGDAVACGGFQRHNATTAEIKRMWVHADWRGEGIGRRLLGALEAEADRRGYAAVVLDTHSALTEAISMYERSGYSPIERYNDNPYAFHWFHKQLG